MGYSLVSLNMIAFGADALNPEIDRKVRDSLEELKIPEDEINDIIEGR